MPAVAKRASQLEEQYEPSIKIRQLTGRPGSLKRQDLAPSWLADPSHVHSEPAAQKKHALLLLDDDDGTEIGAGHQCPVWLKRSTYAS